MRASRLLFFLFCCLIAQKVSAQIAGYREYKAIDSTRRYKPEAVKGDRLYYRPQEMDVWYPADPTAGRQPLDFGYFLSLFERRANSFQDSVKYNGLAGEMMQHFLIGNNTTTVIKTRSFLNATPLKGNFPVILYLSSFNGMSYENIPLFEQLAARGYVVASISSIGRYPGNMTTKYPDALEQVKDAEFALHYLSGKGLDTSQIVLVDYSYGGIAAVLLAMRHSSVKALLSLDGSERHYYGRDKEEDRDFDELRHSIYWQPSPLRATYAYLESDHKEEDGAADSVYRLPQQTNDAYARLNGAEHEDFSGVSDLAFKKGAPYEVAVVLAADYADQWLKGGVQPFTSRLRALAAAGKISLSPKAAAPKVGQFEINGRVVDAANGTPLPYVSIGIPSGNCGTVSDDSGRFTLHVPDTLANHPVRISSLGYQAMVFSVGELKAALKAGAPLRLRQQTSELNDVTISAVKPRSRVIGNTSQSKFLNVGFPFRDLGSEVGIKVSLGKKKVLLRKFNFSISNTRMDSCTFRLNIYSLREGMPDKNILTQNIIKAIGNLPGNYTIDLSPYRLFMNGTVLVSLEWIAGNAASGNGAVFFSAGMLSSSYHRKTTEADWVKFKGLGAGFNLEVIEE